MPTTENTQVPDADAGGRHRSISFGHNVQWCAISQADCRALAKSQSIKPLALRVYFAAVGWGNQIGHAEFQPGHLGMQLGVSTRQGIHDAISRAKDMGLVLPDSGSRCLVLPSDHYQKARKGTRFCQFHGLGC